METESTYQFIDLFSGCGGMSLGFEMCGFSPALAIDNWQDALTTYTYNRKGAKTLCADLSTIDPYQIKAQLGTKKIDIIIGGPPCQGFSVAGKRIIDDKRNTLYRSFVKFVEAFSPKAFVMENVPQILTMGNGIILNSIIHDFENIGYRISYKILTASDYGVPQNRRRAFFVGTPDINFKFPEKTKEDPITSKDALSDLPLESLPNGSSYTSSPNSPYQELIRRGSKGVYNHEVTVHTENTRRIISMVPDGGNYKDLPIELQNIRKVHIAWTRLNSKKPSFTIDCGHNHHFHYEYPRVPTVRESARLQSFPDKIFVYVFSFLTVPRKSILYDKELKME
ncbi:MAG: DNA cytosine methyltransferase [Bacteroidales bacterium]|nr:DNA cytosine methyltransferase [Bacteroidales bacterium]